ncbi:tyrosine-type recombinase/integrase [Acetobacterium bakii]|uniref:Tyr recombinase domain-containing protein n=1 Tax=Acetobacterium bakii TaxID=52689 RepID=A0A0L6U266_9FIRM|nr:site-specific integrase [Acetobacterium bakii]KNZ42427.1 hypothetical protein AKG39_06595 [Acetobacterium bakii]
MAKTRLALKSTVIEPDTDLDQVMIGSSRFSDDLWDLKPFISAKATKDSQKKLFFEYITEPEMKQTVKHYAYHMLGKIKPQSVRNQINSHLPRFIEYCSLNGIKSFVDVTQDDFLCFNIWLKDTRKMSQSGGYNCSHVVENIIKVGQIKDWHVPKDNIFKGFTSNQLWDIKQSLKPNRTKPIPEDVFDRILHHAVHDETDILTKAGIIIQSQTGLRISEVLSIQEGCVKVMHDGDSTYDYMEATLPKTEKGEAIIHKVFINEMVKNVIEELTKATIYLRKESGLKELLLIRYHGIRVLNSSKWTENRLKNFIKRWDIRDNKGVLYPLKSHQFRATFVRELIKQKIPIAMIMKQYAHVSIEMTAGYLTLQEEEVKEIYADMILSPESKISGLRANEIKDQLDNLFYGKTEDEIDSLIDDLSKSMSFNPLPTGVCLYDFRRGNCTDGDGCFMYNCPNYITEVRFYPILKIELDLLEKEMGRLKTLGYEREWQKQHVKHEYLKPLVESLEVQLHEETSIR